MLCKYCHKWSYLQKRFHMESSKKGNQNCSSFYHTYTNTQAFGGFPSRQILLVSSIYQSEKMSTINLSLLQSHKSLHRTNLALLQLMLQQITDSMYSIHKYFGISFPSYSGATAGRDHQLKQLIEVAGVGKCHCPGGKCPPSSSPHRATLLPTPSGLPSFC